MKRIVRMCANEIGNAHNIIKIRLRGKGSGFKEGLSQTECEDPLHICVSSRFYDKYAIAAKEVSQLLKAVY